MKLSTACNLLEVGHCICTVAVINVIKVTDCRCRWSLRNLPRYCVLDCVSVYSIYFVLISLVGILVALVVRYFLLKRKALEKELTHD